MLAARSTTSTHAETTPFWGDEVSDPSRIEATLRALAAREAVALAHGAAGTVRGQLVSLFGDGPWPLRARFDAPPPEGPFDLDLVGYNAVHRVRVGRLLHVGGTWALPLPTRIQRLQHRRTRRAATPSGYSVTFHHPAFPEVVVQRAVRDVSRGGLCFESRPDQDMLAVGLQLHDVVVTAPSGQTLQFEADVRVLHAPRRGAGPAVGLRLRPSSSADATRWEQVVGEALNPATQLGATWSEDSWDLYTQSGYFNLSNKSGPHFAALKAPFAAASRKLDAAPEVGCQVSWPSDRGIEASISVLKLYTHTWFGYQMAKLPGQPLDGTPGKDVLRDIHLRAYEHAASDPSLQWIMGFVQESARWSKLVHHDLPARHVDSGKACIHGFHAIELAARPAAATPGWDVGPAHPEERAALLARITRTRPWAYREALDLVPERFDLEDVRGPWRRAGFTRDRALLVVRRDGRALAAAVVEGADRGLHLFNLLDTARLYTMAPDGELAFPALLEAVAGWHHARGRDTFCWLAEEGGLAQAARFSPRDLGRGFTTLLHTDLLPSFMEHVHEVTAPRLPRG
jgi:hypothetical protein